MNYGLMYFRGVRCTAAVPHHYLAIERSVHYTLQNGLHLTSLCVYNKLQNELLFNMSVGTACACGSYIEEKRSNTRGKCCF